MKQEWKRIKNRLVEIGNTLNEISKIRLNREAFFKKVVDDINHQVVINNSKVLLYKTAEKKDKLSPETLNLGLEAMADTMEIFNNKFALMEKHVEELYHTIDAQRECISLLRKNVVDLGRVITEEERGSK